MPDFSGTAPGIPSIAERFGISGVVDPAITGAIRDAAERGRTGSGTGTGGAPAVDPNAWATDAINALNEAEQLLKDLTTAISTGDVSGLADRTYGYELTGAGTSGDTLAAAFISTKVQSITGGVTENAMTAARRSQEIQKKVWG